MLSFDDQKQIELRSDEVQEILGTPPGWLVRWGTTVALIGFVSLLIVSWMVRYPDVISAPIVLTTSNPPVAVISRVDAPIIRILVKDNEEVKQGQPLLVLESTANYTEVLSLDRELNQWRKLSMDSLALVIPPDNLDLGDLQEYYSDFVQKLENFRFGTDSKSLSVDNNIASINQQIQRLQQSINFEAGSRERAEKQVERAKDMYRRQEGLFNQGLISKVALEREQQRVSDAETALDNIKQSILQKQTQIINLRSGINDATANEQEDVSSQRVKLRESLHTLRNQMDTWKQNYILTAPVPGKISMNTGFYAVQQFVKNGEHVLTVVPPSDKKYIGRMSLPVTGSGKVKPGQRVVVKLDSYPFHEFGSIQGEVASKAEVPNNDQYQILVRFPDQLETNYGKQIPFEQQLQGGAEIITDDKRFLERILEQIFALGQ
ncbi:MAG: HlyD family efflux transporter periplasmic adaptor subunit [Saprospiraceae bacterium]|jgi:HlyD family secretion protein